MPAEITPDDPFGKAIAAVMAQGGFSSVLEIGSFDGQGSTQVFIESLRGAASPRLVCVEANPARHLELRQRTAAYPWVSAVCRSSISLASLTPRVFDRDVWQSPYNGLQYPRKVVEDWWHETQRTLAGAGRGYLESTTDTFDVALIDGDEFTGYDDYRLIKDRVRCLMLDDAFHAFKCHRANRELAADPAWFPVWCDSTVRNGAAIWVRR
jgi:predicted O-methyltransferase YrrM